MLINKVFNDLKENLGHSFKFNDYADFERQIVNREKYFLYLKTVIKKYFPEVTRLVYSMNFDWVDKVHYLNVFFLFKGDIIVINEHDLRDNINYDKVIAREIWSEMLECQDLLINNILKEDWGKNDIVYSLDLDNYEITQSQDF